MIWFPALTIQAAADGLLLWFNEVLPILLPFLIITDLFSRFSVSELLCKPLAPLLRPLFRVSTQGLYPIVVGFLSGFPIGARLSAELVRQGKISHAEGQYLAGMTNNAGPMFILGYVAIEQLSLPSCGIWLCGIVYLASVIGATLTVSRKHLTPLPSKSVTAAAPNTALPVLHQVEEAIFTAFTVITKIGGYVILFTILSAYLHLLPLPTALSAVFIALFEITGGVRVLATSELPFVWMFTLICACTAFGGLSCLAQTHGVIAESGISLRIYLKTKIAAACVAAILGFFYAFLFSLHP